MEIELVVSSGAVGESNFHLQLTPAYRQTIFEDELVRELMIACIAQKLKQHKVVLSAYGFGTDLQKRRRSK